jgi:SAM-dependent methyltransferase
MISTFGNSYADLYDLFYKDKNYEKECDIVERILKEHSSKTVKSILDLGCGTGNYAIPLTKRGYSVTGVDISENMLKIARSKNTKRKITFIHGDVKKINIESKFDLALMMFAVLGYQLENTDVIQTLKNVRDHLTEGCLFIFDVWFGPTVLAEKPSLRIKTFSLPDSTKVIRKARGELDNLKQRCKVSYNIHITDKNQRHEEFEEKHEMRFFFPLELEYYLKNSGFQLQTIHSFPEYKKEITKNDWNIIVVAKAI